MERRQRCPLCNGPITRHWSGQVFDRCLACGVIFRNPQPDAAALRHLYRESWSDPEHCVNETGDTTRQLADMYARRLATSLGRRDFHGLTILDFGAGRGAMTDALSSLGGAVWGVEPYGAELLRREGRKVVGSLEELPTGLEFDGAVALEVVEHLPDPPNELRHLRGRLREGGWLCVTTPNPRGLAARLQRGAWREATKATHVMFFPPRGLAWLLQEAGFTRSQRLRWSIRYTPRKVRRLVHYVLQAAGLDGQLQFLGWR